MALSRRVRRLLARRGTLGIVAVGATLLIAAVWLAILYESARARDRAFARGGEVLGSLAVAFAAHVDRTIVGIDQALITIRDHMTRSEGPFDFARAVADAPALADIGASLALLDASGIAVAGNEPVVAGRPPLAGYFFFAGHVGVTDRLVVTEPLVSPLTSRCDFFASRSIRDRGGRLTGVLVLSVPPAYLIDLFGRAALGTDGAVALIGDNGVVWARAGSAPVGCVRRLPDLQGMMRTSAVEDGLLEVSSPVDSLHRLVAFRRVGALPFQVFTGMAKDDVLAPARREGWRYILFGLALTLTLAAGAVLVGRDVTKRQRVQRMLRRINLRLAASRRTAEARRQQLMASVLHGRDGISIFDPDGRLVLSNYAHRSLLGYPEELVRPGTPGLAHLRFQLARGDFGAMEDPEAEAQRLYHRFRNDPPLHFERAFPDGKRLLYRRAVTPDGSIVTIYTDVTEQRRQIAELRAARRTAIEAAERKSELLGVVGHEIRTPMTGIVGFLDLLAGTELTLEQRTYLGIATTSSQALLALLDDVLTHARIEAGRLPLQLADWALSDLLNDTGDLFRPTAARKGVHIQVRPAADLPRRVVTDGVRLRQILGNLVANAVRLTPTGTVTVAAEIERAADDDFTLPRRWLRFSVQDDGPGVPDGEKATIFEAYVQGQGGLETAEGSGLGLAVCRRLVELFGGRIGVADAPGGGAVFWFTVPLRPSENAGAAVPSTRPRLRTLVVEDNPANQYLARRFLEHLGHDATVVPAADAAESRLGAEAFDLLILDRRLADGDGLDLLRRIRARRDGDRMAIILATAAVTDEGRAEAIAAGADHFLPKPYAIDDLAGAIDRSRQARAA